MHSGAPFQHDGREYRITSEECALREPGSRFGLCRLELEADIEYLMAEGVHMIWQATGDDEWLQRNLPRVEKGLRYIMTDPLRWDAEHQLAKRPRTLDTWDFLDREDSSWDRPCVRTTRWASSTVTTPALQRQAAAGEAVPPSERRGRRRTP